MSVDAAEQQFTRELAREQSYADRLYERLDELIAQVERNLDRIQASQHASTHQNRSERDSFMALYEDRLALLRSVSRAVVFGRLDTDDGARRYIGRIGLFTPEREQLLVDWRAPAASAFYQATSADPQGGAAAPASDQPRTHDHGSRGRCPGLLGARGRPRCRPAGRGRSARRSLRPAHRPHGRHRRHHPGRAGPHHRSENRGVLVVQGGPGTGKTAVACIAPHTCCTRIAAGWSTRGGC